MQGETIVLVLATSTGGTGAHVHSLTQALVGRGSRVTVCGPQSTEAAFGFAAAGACFAPVEIAAGPRPLAGARALIALRTKLRSADLVHAHGLRAGLLAGLAAPRGVPYVVTWHNAVLGAGPTRTAYAALERMVARRADVSLCVSPDLEARVRELGGRDVRPGPVAAEPLPAPRRSRADVRAELGAGDRPLVLSFGRLHPQKGFLTLVAAAARLRVRRPPPLVVIAGEGPQRAALATAIRRAGVPLRLLGWRTDRSELLAAADVVVLPSRWEGSPLAVQEALLAGRPLVATSVGGVPGLVRGAAALVPPNDPVALAGAISRVLDDPVHAGELAAHAAAVGADLPSPAATAERVAAVYQELLGRPV
ncbi:MAG: glycosyltransferase family 4 protein [Actinomycetota bacterium]|nr:glycosyltransferase family 4 protein [Actinomycetota bacterium]